MLNYKYLISLSILIYGLIPMKLVSQQAESHKILNANLRKTSFKKLIKEAKKHDVIFFGELHDDPIAHWLQLKLIQELNKEKELIIALEMFERDNQTELDHFLSDKWKEDEFEEKARLWNNYVTDYKPIINFAKEHKHNVIASNIPREYASKVYREGFEVLDKLDSISKTYVAPLPIPYDASLPGYAAMLEMVEGHGGDNFPKAQAIKDATMAWSISEAYKEGHLLIHLNGKYHSDNREGIVWYLRQYRDDVNIMTITTVLSNEEIKKNVADFIIVVDEDMTRTY